MKMNGRSHRELCMDVLAACTCQTLITHVSYKVNTTFVRAKQLTQELLEKRLIIKKHDGKRKLYQCTPQGYAALRLWRELEILGVPKE